jgi:dihydrolipoamide dehydrogenase
MEEADLVVLGAGPGGYAAAFYAADRGLNVTLVDQEPRLGGVCLLRGCIPSKALLHVSRVIHESLGLKSWGIHFDNPRIDLQNLRSQKEKVITTLTGGLAQLAKKRNVRVIRAKGKLAGAGMLELFPADSQPLDSDRLRYRHLILAAGSRAVRLKVLEPAGDLVMTSRDALDLPEIPDSLLVVGGGYIGLELGTVYATLGSRVTVVEMTEGLLPGVDRDLVRPLEVRLRKLFAAIHLETKVVGVERVNGQVKVFLQGKDGERTEVFSRILVAVGRRPNSDLLGADTVGLRLTPQEFVEVNEFLETSVPGIWAIGDIAGQPMLAHKATHQGKHAVENVLGEKAPFEPRAIPAVVFTEPEIAWAGLTEAAARAEGREIETAVFPWGASGRAQAVGATDGFTKWIIDRASGRVLGCGIVGLGAGDLIGEACLAIEMGAHIADVAGTIHPHPTLCETLGMAAEVYLGLATDIYRPKQGSTTPR